jgi:hypothetical protein
MLNILFLFILSQLLHAQQNLFNIPSGEITSEHDTFYQHQVNFYEGSGIKSKQHLVYGLGSGYEIGANIVDVSVSHFSQVNDRYRPVGVFTLQKGWHVVDNVFFNLGTQLGSTYKARTHDESLTGLNYALFIYRFTGHSRVVIGGYQALNDTFLRGPNALGLLLGYEYFLTKRFGLMGDFISGKTDSSVSVVGFIFSMTKYLQLCAGVLLPNEDSTSRPGVVIELNAFSFEAF